MSRFASHLRSEEEGTPIFPRVRVVLKDLLEAYLYAENVGGCRWEFAITLQELQEIGLKLTDLRWLVKKGFVEHAREVTAFGHNEREFQPTDHLSFHQNTCVILTDSGVLEAQALLTFSVINRPLDDHKVLGAIQTPSKPIWDPIMRELRFGENLIKRFKWHAENQELVLDAFEEEGWPVLIDDPLPPKPNKDSKVRMQETIKALNKRQETKGILRFRGNGTADGVRWEITNNVEKKRCS